MGNKCPSGSLPWLCWVGRGTWGLGHGLFTFALLSAIVIPGSGAWGHWKGWMIRACLGNWEQTKKIGL